MGVGHRSRDSKFWVAVVVENKITDEVVVLVVVKAARQILLEVVEQEQLDRDIMVEM